MASHGYGIRKQNNRTYEQGDSSYHPCGKNVPYRLTNFLLQAPQIKYHLKVSASVEAIKGCLIPIILTRANSIY